MGYNTKMILRDGHWFMTWISTTDYTVGQTISMFNSLWRVDKVKKDDNGNVYIYTLSEIEDRDNQDALPT